MSNLPLNVILEDERRHSRAGCSQPRIRNARGIKRVMRIWGEQSGSNRHLPRSRRGALSLSYAHHCLAETERIELSRPEGHHGFDSRHRRSPFGRTACVCRRCAPRRKTDKHASLARLCRLVTAVGFKPTSSRVQTGRSDPTELHREKKYCGPKA